MHEVESKRRLIPTDGAHIFFTLIFLIGVYLLKNEYKIICGVNFKDWLNVLFYSLTIWMAYLMITLIPRFRIQGLRMIFNFLDSLNALFHLGLAIYASVLYFGPENNCSSYAPELQFFVGLYLFVIYFTFSIIFMILIFRLFKKYIKPHDVGTNFQQADL